MYELNVWEFYTDHRLTSYERWCLLSRRADLHVTLMRWDCPVFKVWVSLALLVFEPILRIYGSGEVQFPYTLAFMGDFWIWRGSVPIYASIYGWFLPVTPTLLSVGGTLDIFMLTWSMSVKVNVPHEWMRPASNDGHNKMNDTKGVMIG